VPTGAVSVNFVSVAGAFLYPGDVGGEVPFGAIELIDTGVSQEVFIEPVAYTPDYDGGFTLFGPEGSLFGSYLDPATLHAGPITGASAYFFASRDVGAGVDITGVVLNGVAFPPTSIPAPPSLYLIVTGLLGLAAVRTRRALLPAGLIAAACLAPGAARADALAGSFTGTATNSIVFYNGTNFDGTPITGMFSLPPQTGYGPSPSPIGSVEFYASTTDLYITFNYAFGTYVYPNGVSAAQINLSDTGTVQELDIEPEAFLPKYNAVLSLFGPEGSLFSNLDPATIHAGAISGATASFFAAPADAADVDIAGLVVNGVAFPATAIPAPASWCLLLTGLLGIAAARAGGQAFARPIMTAFAKNGWPPRRRSARMAHGWQHIIGLRRRG